MGQENISEILGRSLDWMSLKELVKESGLSRGSVIRSVRVLKRRDEVEYKVVRGVVLRSGWVTLYRVKGGKIK